MLVKLILKNCIPLAKKGASSVELNTESIFNVILGRNGYGKTTLLRMMHPFPPENSDFEEGGYKEIQYRIKNNFFRLVSHTGKKSSSHEFWFNGKNLNEGATMLVQRDLVKQYFGITPDVMNVLTGLDRSDCFSSLPAQRRKNVLMDINPNDTKYGVKIYNNARISYNQTRGALKHQRQRLVAEERRQLELKSLSTDELQAEVSRLDGLIKDALLLHGSLQHIKDPDIGELTEKMSHIMSQLLSTPNATLYPASHYHELIRRTQMYIEHDKTRLSGLQALLTNITEKINNFNIPEGMDLKGYETKIEECSETIKRLQEKKVELLAIIQREEIFKKEDWREDGFKIDLNNFLKHVRNVEITEDKTLSSGGYIKYQEELKEWETKVNVTKKEIENNIHLLRHYENADSVTCPDCSKTFKAGFEKVDPAKLKEVNEALMEGLERFNKKVREIKDLLERNEGWFETMGGLMRFIRHSQMPAYFLDLVKYYEIGKVSQNVLPNILIAIDGMFTVEKEEEENIARQTTLNAQYQLMTESNIDSLSKQYDELSVEMGLVQKRMRKRTRDLTMWTDCLDTINADQLLVEVYENYFGQLQDMVEEKGKYIIKAKVMEVINMLTPQKEKLVTDLIRSESLNSVIQSIKDNITDLEKRERHLKAIMDGLSPVKGFIGELMIDFLNSVTANVNAAIEPIWSDPLKLQACHVEGEDDEIDLDYKFPVIVGDSKAPNEDIKKCSGGEKEIIDFMIRRTLQRYKGEECGIPLMMDEIGTAFDELHRRSFANYVTEQLRLDKLPQTFMISHYVNQYGGFNNKDVNIIALNTKGLDVPLELNTNSIIQ